MGNQGAKIDGGQKQKLRRVPLAVDQKESDARKSGFREIYPVLVFSSSFQTCCSSKNIL